MKKTVIPLMVVMLLVISSNFVIFVGASNNIVREETSLQTSPPIIPQTSTETVRIDQMYVFEFSAEEGDSIHYRVSVDGGSAVAVYLIPLEELSNLRDGERFRIVSDGTNEQTRDFRASVEFPHDGEFAIVIRPVESGTSTVDVVLGSGIYSYIVVILGGYLQFTLLAIFIILITTGIAIYRVYRKRNKDPETELESWEESVIGKKRNEENDSQNEEKDSEKEIESTLQQQNKQPINKPNNQSTPYSPTKEQISQQQQQSAQEPSSRTETPMDKLEELQKMKEDGLISEEDYERKKKEILDEY